MTKLSAQSFSPFQNWPKVAPQIVCASSASLALFCTGLVRGWSSSAVPQLIINSTYHHNNESNSSYVDGIELQPEAAAWITSLPPLCAILGSLMISLPMQLYGRKITLVGISVPFILGFYLMGAAYYLVSPVLLFLGRVITGLATGASAPTAQIYVSECSSPRVRGALGSFTATFLSFGILLAYIIGALVEWHVFCFILGSIPILAGLAMVFMPETPSWLLSRNLEPEAKVALQKLRGKHTDIEAEFSRIKTHREDQENKIVISDERNSYIKILTNRALMKPLLLSIGIMFFQQFSGINAILFYSATIFQEAGSSVDRNVSTITIGTVQLFCTMISALSVDRFGRRWLLMNSGALMAISMGAMAVYLSKSSWSEEVNYGWIPLVCLMTFIVGYSMGYGAVPHLVMGELFPASHRHQLSTISASFNLCCSFLIVRSFPEMSAAMGLTGVYGLYATCSLIGIVFVALCLPETKGRTLEDIGRLFESKN